MFKEVFISHANEDIEMANQLYEFLEINGYSPWLDKKKLKAGANWDYEIKKALKESTFVILLLSSTSVKKRGYVQKEFKYALEYSETKLIDDIYIIPILLDKCEVPDQLSKFHWIDIGNSNYKEYILDSLNTQRQKYLFSIPHKIIEAKLIITNGKLLSPEIYEFDLFLLSTGGNIFSLASQQYGIKINPSFINGGTITIEVISNNTGLTNKEQIPKSITFNTTTNSLNITARSNPGHLNGSLISNTPPGTYVCRIKMQNSTNFGIGIPKLELNFTAKSGLSHSNIMVYVDTKPISIKPELQVILK